MTEHSIDLGDQPARATGPDAPASRPDAWVPAPGRWPGPVEATTPGVSPGPVVGTTAGSTLTYTVTTEDLAAAVLENPLMRSRVESQVRKALWRRGLRTMPIALALVLLANVFMFELDLTWSMLSTLVLGVLFAVVQWSQIDHTIRRRLPAILQQQALHELAQRGDQRRVVAEPAGLTLTDAAGTGRFGWHQVHLREGVHHVILAAGPTSWAIPRRVGRPLAELVQAARGYGVR